MTVARAFHGRGHGGAKALRIGDVVIGGQDDGHALRIPRRDPGHGRGDGWPRVSRLRLDEDRRRAAAELSLHRLDVALAGHDDRGGRADDALEPREGVLEARPLPDQRQELLGSTGP